MLYNLTFVKKFIHRSHLYHLKSYTYDRFVCEENGERKIMQKMMIYLYNLRARKLGINNVYMPALNNDVNEYFLN